MKHFRGSLLTVTLVACSMGIVGCANVRAPNAREKGVLAGGALGAGLGAIVGNQVGNSGAGIAIGSAIGAISGGLIGNEVENQNQLTAEQNRRISENEQVLAENRRLIDELRNRGIDVKETSRGIVANLPDVLFDFGSAHLTDAARDSVRSIAHVADQSRGRRISVEGHTDSVGTSEYNQRLSRDRASVVSHELSSFGVSPRRITSRGYGESKPISSNSSPQGRSRNRRVEVIIENR